jgi:hypothetical protein
MIFGKATKIRIIRSKGSHTLEMTDERVAIDTSEPVILILPDVIDKRNVNDGSDFYFDSKVFEIISYAGNHQIKPFNSISRINGFLSSYPLGNASGVQQVKGRCTATLLDNGNWIIT